MTSRHLSQETTTVTATTGLGELGTTVTSHDHTLHITGGNRPANGTNLFHSFNQVIMVKRLVLIPHQRSFHREKWVWMRAGMRGLTPPARIEQVKH
jgi:hypothetical protein